MIGLRSQAAINEPKSFDIVAPERIEDAIAVLNEFGEQRSTVLAGGCDLIDKLKNLWFAPEMVVNIKRLRELRGVGMQSGGFRIGALTTLTEIEHDAAVNHHYAALSQATQKVATPQIRNVGTIGGNLLQDSRCPYYRGPWNCYRHGGVICDAVRGINAEHAIFGGERCYTVNPSDTAPALLALDAKVKIAGSNGERIIPIDKLFLHPGIDITHMHSVRHGEILTDVILPQPIENIRSCFIKKAMRQSWDFALASVAVSLQLAGDRCEAVRIVLGAVAPAPWRCYEAEEMLRGQRLGSQIIEDAARAAMHGASVLEHNEYKVGLSTSLVRRALLELAGGNHA